MNEQLLNNNQIKILNNNQIKILNDLLHDIQIYINIHDKSAQYYSFYNNIITIPLVIIL